MLAEEFGYQVSSQLARDMTPELASKVDEAIEQLDSAHRKLAKVGENACWVFGIVCVITAAAVGDLGATLLIFLVGIAVGFFFRWAATAGVLDNRGSFVQARTVALAGRWQAWPCRTGGHVSHDGSVRVLRLLDPHGATAVTFQAHVPDEAWMGMIDGRGLVWFAGDIRYGGYMALPGGSPLWWVLPYHLPAEPPAAESETMRLVEEELARQAVGFIFDRWTS
ncbi:hypothetical protein [Streptomyces sp. NPDC059970]|uniref:hypothetical protein n=1 Tax=Streptomyces sp. NPDC059970 TaxID=3347019 RepID=UPI0036A92B7A